MSVSPTVPSLLFSECQSHLSNPFVFRMSVPPLQPFRLSSVSPIVPALPSFLPMSVPTCLPSVSLTILAHSSSQHQSHPSTFLSSQCHSHHFSPSSHLPVSVPPLQPFSLPVPAPPLLSLTVTVSRTTTTHLSSLFPASFSLLNLFCCPNCSLATVTCPCFPSVFSIFF